eukprot:TRINITY_DN36550_c0_g1_i1.p1 TRINITY_DN36550_c0_g1~~TRINITY_DN36550_c0_g1_i1.p1  ORF type:complete len:356 (+),score=40.93 TRINITY_DN36550_c0_g1_i1:193-1260(+)
MYGNVPLNYFFLSSTTLLSGLSYNVCFTALIGYFMALIGILKQSSERKRKEKKLAMLACFEELKEKSASLAKKNMFIATLTHEIRNIVTSIVSNTLVLQDSEPSNRDVVNELVQATSVLSEILNNTLDISKLEEGKIVFNRKFEAIQSVVDTVVSLTRVNAQKKNISVTSEYAEKLPSLVEIDKSRLTQVIMNLVGNAIKFTPEQGNIAIKVKWKMSELEITPIPQQNNNLASRVKANLKKIKEFRRDSVPVLLRVEDNKLLKRGKLTYEESEDEDPSLMNIPDENNTEEVKQDPAFCLDSTLSPSVLISSKMLKYSFVPKIGGEINKKRISSIQTGKKKFKQKNIFSFKQFPFN